MAVLNTYMAGLFADVVESESENCDRQQDQVDDEAPQFVEDPNKDLVGNKEGHLAEICADFL